MKQKAKKILLDFTLIYIFIVGGLYFAQRALIYFPAKAKPDITPYVSSGVFEATTQTEDGLNLTAWVRKADEGKQIIVRFHGNAYNHEGSLYKASPLVSSGYGFLSVGYRGYNGDAGKPSEQGLYKDARAWMNYILESGVLPENIVLYGESVGTGVAVQMAIEFPDVKALVLEAPYTSLSDVAAQTFFFIPVHFLIKDKFDNLSKVKDVMVPFLILYGSKDKIILPKLSKQLFEAANDPKEIISLEGYGHNDMPIEVLSEQTIKFLDKL